MGAANCPIRLLAGVWRAARPFHVFFRPFMFCVMASGQTCNIAPRGIVRVSYISLAESFLVMSCIFLY